MEKKIKNTQMFYFWYWKKTETKSFHFKPFLANKIRTKQNIYFSPNGV